MRWARRERLIASVLVVVGLLASCGDDDPGTPGGTQTPPELTSADVLKPGPYGVGVTTMTLEDTSRPTMANGSFPGAPNRTLVTEIWYPAAAAGDATIAEQRDAPVDGRDAPYPLIIYSHGFMSDRRGGAYLARQLASLGYTVASPDYPLTFAGAPGGPNALDVAEQPGDVHFLIDRLLSLSAPGKSRFAGAIDAQRIGLTGLSLGGLTTFLATFHPTLRDPRIRAAAPIAGPACFLTHAFYGERAVPLLILHGDIDAIVPYRQNAVFAFQHANAPKRLVTIVGGSHTGFADGIEQVLEGANNPDDLGCRALAGVPQSNEGADPVLSRLGGAANGVVAGDCPPACTGPRPHSIRPSRQHELTILSIVPFFEATLRGDQRARRFLDTTLTEENSELALQHQP
jgi:predicted dienelactone hydrolase